jgi:putative membrane protein
MHYYAPITNGNNWGWGIPMMFLWFVFIVLGALFITQLLRGHDHHTYHDHRVDPLDIAKERYAKGEITKEQFNELKKDLAK